MSGTGRNSADELVQKGSQFDLRGAFMLRQDQLQATLGVGRAIGGHPVVVGDSSELNWRGMIESILPTRYRVSKAFVVDSLGQRSDQVDLLIFDRHFSPVLVDVGDYLFVPAEAVYAVLEVKQELNSSTVKYAAHKVASVRRLSRTSAPIPHAGGTFEAREPPPIIGGVLTLEAGWTRNGHRQLEAALGRAKGDSVLDLGCALRSWSFEVDADQKAISFSEIDTALIFFVLRLLKRLQQLASATAIAYDEYGSVLEGGVKQ